MQNVTLTSEEREVVLAYALRLERRSRHWRVLRWLAVPCVVSGVGLLAFVPWFCEKIYSSVQLTPGSFELAPSAGSKSVESSLQLLVSHGDAQVVALRVEMYLLARALIAAGIGMALLVHVVSEWNRDQRDRLVIRLLRLFVSSEAGDEQSES